MDIDVVINKIVERYNVPEQDLRDRYNLLVREFKIPHEEAIKTILNWAKKEYQIQEPIVLAESKKISELSECNEGQFVNIKGKIIQLWEPNSEKIAQVGLIGDETGTTKFVIWTTAENVPTVEVGKCYVFENVAVSFYNNKPQIQANRFSTIKEIDEDIQLPKREIDFVAPLVHIQGNSGLISRCPQCHRVVQKGICPVHGKVKPYDDLRVKAVFDNGETVYNVILNEDCIKTLTGIDLEKAKKIAMDTLDRNAVLETIMDQLLGRYFKVKGTIAGDWILATEITVADFDPSQIPSEVIING
jgi:replication factor A1